MGRRPASGSSAGKREQIEPAAAAWEGALLTAAQEHDARVRTRTDAAALAIPRAVDHWGRGRRSHPDCFATTSTTAAAADGDGGGDDDAGGVEQETDARALQSTPIDFFFFASSRRRPVLRFRDRRVFADARAALCVTRI